MSFEKVLIVEDEPVVRNLQTEIFTRRKFAVSTAETLAQAEALLTRESFDLVMLDIRLPDGDGQQFLERLATLPERPLVVMVTGYGSIESAVSCMRAGAFDYVLKPFTPSQIDIIIKKGQSYRQLLQVNKLLSDQQGEDEGSIIGKSPTMLRLRQLIERVAPTDATVLITGENGTGKEMVARELYRRSPRRQNPFIKVNCAAISENLIESEFFGHERGAFTGATDRREGRFELANQGTLLLDEVSEIPANLQAKLLRVLQEREFERVGGNRTIKVNVRILATSNRDLLSYVEKGAFRQDLYYRLNVFPVHVPPLRERAEDILPLADHFLARFARKFGIKVTGFSESARNAMLGYRWPGNVRELQNTIERSVILTEEGRAVSAAALGLPLVGSITSSGEALLNSSVPFDFEQKTAPAATPAAEAPAVATTDAQGRVLTIAEVEKQAIKTALQQTGGNRTKAAELLGISIRTLRNKLQEYRDAGEPIEVGAETGE
ncbi:sigma-54-dependent transcriptional regulator [Oleiharenicola sp. Vm1]|uniref:sigma-54-dependent transcriptional regulator n=1 Tax=Oleiharenicola sp. Vm1 TaxID=3398393 RepID=UPI0039F61827